MKTLKSKLTLEGKGLMTNTDTVFEINPSDKEGIRFHIQDSTIEADIKNVVSTDHCVVVADIMSGAKNKVMLIEHFMAACAITGLDSLDVNILKGFETPIFDGSSKVWVEEFNKTGFKGTKKETKPLKAPLFFQKGKSSVVMLPSEKTTITYSVNFNHPELKQRWVTMEPDKNLNEIIEARTFGYLKDLEAFQKMGFAMGVTEENTVGMTDTGYTTTLRSEFEPAKHKILDIVGDIYLTGLNPFDLNAQILVKEAGHGLHIEASKELIKTY